jgi:hypothetical protein
MFVLYAILIGVVVGVVVGGRLGRLSAIQFRSSGLIVAGLMTQLALFSDPVAARVGSLGPAIYVASTAVVLAAVIRNATIPGLPLVAAGASLNLAAIVANGGYMPASAAALGAHAGADGTYSNSVVLAQPALAPLTDVLAMPAWLPWANVFSIGDVAIMLGMVMAIVVQMRSREAIDIRDRIVRFGPLGNPNLPRLAVEPDWAPVSGLRAPLGDAQSPLTDLTSPREARSPRALRWLRGGAAEH